MGNEVDLWMLVDSVYQCGICIFFDVVMNYIGYVMLVDMQEYQFGVLYFFGDEVKKLLGECWSDWKFVVG